MNISIYQIYYKAEQLKFLDPAFLPLDISKRNNPRWCEYQVFLDNEKTMRDGTADYYGFVSWKFYSKTHIRGQNLFRVMHETGGADVYFVNPFETSIAGLYKNVWTQLDSVFPGVLPIVQDCLNQAGYSLHLQPLIMTVNQTAYCNYWFATKEFWREYMAFTLPLYQFLEHDLDKETRAYFCALDKKNHLGLYPHIMERMFSTFLASYPGRFRVTRIPLASDIQEIAPEIVKACNCVRDEMAQNSHLPAVQHTMDAQDMLLSHLLRYKQTAERDLDSCGLVMRLGAWLRVCSGKS